MSGDRARDDTLYPCAKCGKPRTKAEGGTTFTVCDACWEDHYHPKAHRDDAGQDFPALRAIADRYDLEPDQTPGLHEEAKALLSEIERLKAELRNRTLEHVEIRKGLQKRLEECEQS